METITKNHGFRDCGRKLYVGTLLGNVRGGNLTAAADRPQLRKAFCPFQKVIPGVRKVEDAGFNEVTEIRT